MHITTSANKVADFIVAKTPQRRQAIVRQVMRSRQNTGYAPYYSAFGTPAKEFLKGGAIDPGIIHRAIKSLDSRTSTSAEWLAIDNRITREAFLAFLELGPKIQAKNVTYIPAPRSVKATLEYPNITVKVSPDFMVEGERNGVPLFGAGRFYLAKDQPYQLGRRGAELVATMEYLWCVKTATGKRAPDSSLCVVLECIQQRVTTAPDDIAHYEAVIERGCREFVQVWRQLSAEEAA